MLQRPDVWPWTCWSLQHVWRSTLTAEILPLSQSDITATSLKSLCLRVVRPGRATQHLLHRRLADCSLFPTIPPKKSCDCQNSFWVFPTLAKLLSAIWAIFKVNGNTTKDKEIITIWVQHLQTGLGIFARLLIWKNQTCETDSPCFFPLFFLCFFGVLPC